MEIMVICVCVLIAASSFIKNRLLYDPVFVFSSMFAVVCLLASLRLYDVFQSRWEVYAFIGLGVVSFAIGGFIASKVKLGYLADFVTKREYINDNVYSIFLIITVVGSVFYSLSAIRLILNGATIEYIYHLHMGNDDQSYLLQHSGVVNILYAYVLSPLTQTLLPVTIALYFKRQRFKYLFHGLVLAGLRVIYHGGRAVLFYIIMYFALCTIILKQNKINQLLNNKKNKKRILIILVLSIVIFIIISNMTKQRGVESPVESMYFYLSGCVPNFSQRLDEMYRLDHTYGLEALLGVVQPFMAVLSILIGKELPLYAYATDVFYNTLKPVTIGPNNDFNAYLTPFYSFYIDGGICGIVVESFLFGYWFKRAFLRLVRNSSEVVISLYSLMFVNVLLYSFNACMLSYIQVGAAFLFMIPLFWAERIRLRIIKSYQ